MSLAKAFLRMATVEALTGITQAEGRVKNSTIADLSTALDATVEPIILVFTDEEEFVPQGRELWGGTGSTTLVLLLAVAGASKLKGGEIQFTFPATDASIELTLDTMERQIQAGLMNVDSPWAERWRGIVTKVTKYKATRGGSSKEGIRYGARQILIELETIHDPIPGVPLVGEWPKLFDLMASTPHLQGLVAPMRALAEGGVVPKWKHQASEMGLSKDSMRGIGLGPLVLQTGTDDPVPLEEIEFVQVLPGQGLP